MKENLKKYVIKMNKWELAKILIDCKKNVDSILFIANNIQNLSNLNIRDIVQSKLRDFFIGLRTIYEKTFTKKELSKLVKADEIIEQTKYHADKKYAHKDEEYKPLKFDNICELSEIMKKYIIHCRKVCNEKLPENLTLDFLSFDKVLFRTVYSITLDKEEQIKKLLHVNYGKVPTDSSAKTYKAFHDIDDLNQIEDKHEYAVLIEDGIIPSEGLQNRQDAVIRINVLFNENIWVSVSDKTTISEDDKIMIEFFQTVGMI